MDIYFSKTNPVRDRRTFTPTLDLFFFFFFENFGLSTSDETTIFQASTLFSSSPITLGELVQLLKKLFCETIVSEYKYIRNPKTQAWIEQKINAMVNETPSERKNQILEKLNEVVSFENFYIQKYVGQKRFH